MPEASLKSAAPSVDLAVYRSFVYINLGLEDLYRRMKELSPEVMIFQYWSTAVPFGRSPIPVAIDFHRPLLLEALYQDLLDYESLRQTKIRTLAKVDFFTCASE